MQGLDSTALAAVCMSMNRAGQRGLPALPRQLRAAKPYAERMFAYHELDRLSDAEARLALIAPAAQLGVEYEQAAVELILEASAGYPHFIQEYGRVLWNEVERSPITARDVKSAQALITEALGRRFFRDRFETASDVEQRYLAAMAELGDGPVRSAEVATRAGYKERGSTSALRESLLRKDLVYSPRRGLIDFTCRCLQPTCASSIRSAASSRSEGRSVVLCREGGQSMGFAIRGHVRRAASVTCWLAQPPT